MFIKQKAPALPGLEPGTYQTSDLAANHSATLPSHNLKWLLDVESKAYDLALLQQKTKKNPILKLKKHAFSSNFVKFHLLYLT